MCDTKLAAGATDRTSLGPEWARRGSLRLVCQAWRRMVVEVSLIATRTAGTLLICERAALATSDGRLFSPYVGTKPECVAGSVGSTSAAPTASFRLAVRCGAIVGGRSPVWSVITKPACTRVQCFQCTWQPGMTTTRRALSHARGRRSEYVNWVGGWLMQSLGAAAVLTFILFTPQRRERCKHPRPRSLNPPSQRIN